MESHDICFGTRQNKRLTLKPKNPKKLEEGEGEGVRGEDKINEMVELLTEHWDKLQEEFNRKAESDQDEMMGHFNDVVNNLGDTLFGDGTNPEDFQQFLAGLEDEER